MYRCLFLGHNWKSFNRMYKRVSDKEEYEYVSSKYCRRCKKKILYKKFVIDFANILSRQADQRPQTL